MKNDYGKRILALLFVTLMVLTIAACGRKKVDDTTPPTIDVTEPMETDPPVTEPPVTEPPVTEPPVTEPVATEPPVTETVEPETTDTEPVETEPAETESLCEHKFYRNAKVVIPTCKEEGYTEYTCKLCDEKVKDNFKPVVAHLYVRTVISYASCTTDGLEAMVCTYCGEIKKGAYTDDSLDYKGILTFEEPISVYGSSKNLIADVDFYNTLLLPEENDTLWLNFTLKPIELSGFTTAEGGSTLLKFQINSTHRIMLRAYRVDDDTVKITCQDNAGKMHELADGFTLDEGVSYKFVIEYEYETKKYNIYIDDVLVGGSSFQINYGADAKYYLYVGSSGDWEFSDFEVVNSTHVYGDRNTDYGVIEAYGHTTVTNLLDMPTLTHHKVEVSECERCGEVFYATAADGYEHNFELVERVSDGITDKDTVVYGYEVFECECGYRLTVSSNHADGHFYEVDKYTGKYICRCGDIFVDEFKNAYNGNENAGALISGRENVNE